MRRLVIDGRMINASGIGTYIKNIIPFIYNDFQVNLIANPHEAETLSFGEKINIIPFKNNSVYSLKDQFQISFKIPETDFFWCPHYNAPFSIKKAEQKILTIHDVYHFAYYYQFSIPQRIYVDLIIKNVIKQFDYVITVSEFSKDQILKYLKIKEEKIQVIPNGIDFSFFNEFETDKPTYVSDKKRYLLFVGNVKPHKNITGLLKAFKEILKEKKYNDLYLVIVGKNEGFIKNLKNIPDLLKELDLKEKVIFTGTIGNEELRSYYQNAEMLVFPSFYEGFGLPPLEAMASGTPTVVSNKASLPEVCENASLFFDPADINDMKDKIIEVLTDKNLREQLITNGLKHSEKYTWKQVSEKYKRFFKSI